MKFKSLKVISFAFLCTIFLSTAWHPLAYAVDNAAPVLDSTRSPTLAAINEDPGAPTGAVGTLVSSLVDFASPSGQVDNVIDADLDALLGIAIIATDTTNLTCYYSLSDGATWFAIGAVSSSSARLLAANGSNRIYCQPNADSNGAYVSAITFRAWDQTSGVDGGIGDASVTGGTSAFSSSSDTASLVVTAENDAPSATNLSAAETFVEDTSLNLIDIVTSDVDSSNLTATLTLSSPAVGSLSTGTSGAVTSTYNAGTGVWTASGPTANVNTLLAGTVFTPSSNYNSSFTVATGVSDGALSTTGSKTFTGVAVNDAPSASNLSAAESYSEDTSLNLIDIVTSDVDSSSLTVTLTLSSPAVGSLSTGTSGAVTSTYNAGTGVWTATGATANVNALLAGLTFVPASDVNSSFTLATSVSDGVASALTGTKAFTGVAVNDAPSASNLSAAETYTANTPLDLTDIVTSDVDSSNLTVALTLSSPAVGSLSTGTSGAVTSTYNAGTGVWTAAGAISDVNALLSGLIFTPAVDSTSSFTITTSVTDGVASPVTGSKAFTGVEVNSAPVLDNTKSPALSSVDEDAAVPSGEVGTPVTSLVDLTSPVGGLDNVSDSNTGALLGIAIIAVDENLSCYSTIDNGTNWSAVGSVNITSARLLAYSTNSRIYCRASANEYGSFESAITFHAWDQTSGTNGELTSLIPNGGTTAFSTSSDTASLTITSINDDPIANDDSYSISENSIGTRITVLANDTDLDEDALELLSVEEGNQGGSTTIVFGEIGYTPAEDFVGTETFDYVISDGNGGESTGTVTIEVLSTDKSITAFSIPSSTETSLDEEALTITVTMPHGTDVTALVSTITITGVDVSPASGVAQDFTEPVVYTVTAADESTQDYTVTVEVSAASHSGGTSHGGGGGSGSSSSSSQDEEDTDVLNDTSIHFTDTEGHWAETYIDTLSDECGIEGYTNTDGSLAYLFGPDDTLLRAELVEIMVKCHDGASDSPTASPFNDVPVTAWYASSIAQAKALGWVEGYEDGTFKPLTPITRIEALKIILLSSFEEGDIPEATPNFSDTPEMTGDAPWFYRFIAFAVEKGLVSGYVNAEGESTGKFGPTDFMLRGQVAKVVVEALD